MQYMYKVDYRYKFTFKRIYHSVKNSQYIGLAKIWTICLLICTQILGLCNSGLKIRNTKPELGGFYKYIKFYET